MMNTLLPSGHRAFWLVVVAPLLLAPILGAQQPSIETRLEAFDAYMAQVIKDWNVPGIGVGIVVKDKLVLYEIQPDGRELMSRRTGRPHRIVPSLRPTVHESFKSVA
jgi:hypothetical protein